MERVGGGWWMKLSLASLAEAKADYRPRFAGPKHLYRAIFEDVFFWKSVGLALLYTALALVVEIGLGLALALLLVGHPRPGPTYRSDEPQGALVPWLRTALGVPMTLTPLVVGLTWRILDGAGRLATLRHVTLPGLRRAIAAAALLRAVDLFKAFDVIFIVTEGGPGTATEALNLFTCSISGSISSTRGSASRSCTARSTSPPRRC